MSSPPTPTTRFPGAVEDWARWLVDGLREDEVEEVRCHTRTGQPLGSLEFVERLEGFLNRVLRPQRVVQQPRRGAK